jgi:hypothetical protein
MRQRTPLLVRGLATGLMAIGLVGATALPVAAEEICQDQPVLAAVDGNGDGVASVGEIRSVAPDNAELQAAADQLDARGVTGIRYTGCDGGAGDGGAGGADDGGTGAGGADDGGAGDGGAADGTASGDGAEASGSGSGTDSATTDDGSTGTSAGSADGAETGDGTTGSADVSISGLPSTGQGASASGWDATKVMLILSAASIMALGAAVTLRKRSMA